MVEIEVKETIVITLNREEADELYHDLCEAEERVPENDYLYGVTLYIIKFLYKELLGMREV